MSIYKNVASQKIAVYAYDTSADGPKTGDAANITAQISKDFGASAATNDASPTELDATNQPGVYVFDLTQAETNADVIVITAVSSTGDIVLDPIQVFTAPPNFRALGIESDGHVHSDVKEMLGVGQSVTDLKHFADSGYDPATSKITGCKVNDDMRGTDSAMLAASAPANFGDLAITETTGRVTVGTNADKTDYGLSSASQAALVAAIEAEIADDATGEAVKQAIIDKLIENLPDLDDLTLAAIATAVWDKLTSALSTANSIGKLIVDNLNATVSSRASQTSVDNLENLDAADVQTAAAAALTAYDGPTNAEMVARTLAAAEYATANALATADTVVDAIKAKTDNLPGAPAATGDSMALTNAAIDAVLVRNFSNVDATAPKRSLAGAGSIATKSDVVGDQLLTKKDDDTTLHTFDLDTNEDGHITGIS